MCEVHRSPARVSWLIKYNGIILDTGDTKRDAQAKADKLNALLSKGGLL